MFLCVWEWESVLKGIKLGGVHKIVLHNANSALRGSDMVLSALLLSFPSSTLFFTCPPCEKMCLVFSDNSFWAVIRVYVGNTQVITEDSVREFQLFCLQPQSVITTTPPVCFYTGTSQIISKQRQNNRIENCEVQWRHLEANNEIKQLDTGRLHIVCLLFCLFFFSAGRPMQECRTWSPTFRRVR